MKNLLIIFAFVLLVGCATQEGTIVKDDPIKPNNPVVTSTPPSLPPKIVYVEKKIQDPNSIKITDLVWETSSNWGRINSSPDYKFIFDLGVAFQIGVSDGFNGRRTTREERSEMYPIMKEYLVKDKIKHLELNVAYEGGFDMAVKYIKANTVIRPEPKVQNEEQPKEKVIKGKTGEKQN